jgi:GNAT superfamily N-acetyltransferase
MDKVLTKVMKEGHKKWAHDPHWYVYSIGMDAEKQGKGYGRKLMSFISSIADATELPVYLETHGPRNRRFYENNGYVVKEGKILEHKGSKSLDKHEGFLIMVRPPSKK